MMTLNNSRLMKYVIIVIGIMFSLVSCSIGEQFEDKVEKLNIEYIYGGLHCGKQGYIKISTSKIEYIGCDDPTSNGDWEVEVDRIYSKRPDDSDSEERMKYLILLKDQEAAFIVQYHEYAEIYYNGIYKEDFNLDYTIIGNSEETSRANASNYVFIAEPITVVRKF